MSFLIHHSLPHHASLSPENEAFRCRGDSLTYQALSGRSAQLANTLVELGVSSMDRVGIFMGKCIEMPIATYGILMAGGAYVPIDPNAPAGRVRYILENCGIKVLITNRIKLKALKKVIAENTTQVTHIVGVSEKTAPNIESITWDSISLAKTTPPDIETREDDLAYIMYTSGSTGTPKGLMHTHRSGLAYARYSSELYEVNKDDILGNHAPLHFDISTFEYLTGPYVGATSVLIPEEEIMFPVSLANFIASEKLTFLYSVPLALIQMVAQANLSELNFSSLKWIMFGGEPIPPKYLRDLIQAIPNTRFCNVYGPAEVNQCTYYHIPKDFNDIENPVPIGKVWDGAKGLIVDSDDNIIQSDDIGELLISSTTMMQGYWGRDDLNSVAFYHDEPLPGFKQRYYRTGDLVRKDNKGLLHFIGRKDRQIKMRGYRLELDEIEAALTSHPDVEEAAVFLETADGDNSEKRLIAALTIRTDSQYSEKSVLRHIQDKLPSYGIPQSIEVIASFPRTTSGKIDRAQLQRNRIPNTEQSPLSAKS